MIERDSLPSWPLRVCFLGDAGHTNLMSWVAFLDKLGLDIHIITFNSPCDTISGVKVHRIERPMSGSKLRYVAFIPEVRRLVGAIRPDVLVGYRITSYGLMAVNAGFRPVVVVAQGSDIFGDAGSMIKGTLLRYIIRKAQLVQTWAVHMEDALIRFGADRNRLLVLPKGIDTDLFRIDGGRKADRIPTIISTRQLRKSYGHDCVIDALRILAREGNSARLLLCGDGEHRETLEARVREAGLAGRVAFPGRIRHQDLPGYLNRSDVYVSMQGSDGVSSSLHEAMACGVFPIVTDIEANRLWVRDGVNGFLVPPMNPAALADRIGKALVDDELRQRAMVVNAGIVSEKCSMARNMGRIVSRYQELAARPHA